MAIAELKERCAFHLARLVMLSETLCNRNCSMPAPDYYDYFGKKVPSLMPEIDREMYFIAHGGRWRVKKTQRMVGNGLPFHFKEAVRLIWPEIAQHRWFDLFVEEWLTHDYVGVLGPKNSGKSLNATICHLVDYYAHPMSTTVLICSTTKERLEDRIWGEIKKFHRLAQSRWPSCPGHLIEGRQRIVSDDRDQASEGRDFRNGMIGVPCKRGDKFVGIADFQGIKNKRVRLCGDELAALPKTFIDAIATLDTQGDFKVTGMGNPAQTTDALGILCEPHVSIGGWDGGIDQTPKTKTWKTRFEGGICIQFPGSDSPNMESKIGDPAPYPFLMTREVMERDAQTWGKDDWHYTMFDEGRMPHGQGSRRVITRQICLKNKALEEPVWLNSNLTYITGLDAAYRSVGGDRCVLMRLAFGPESYAPDGGKILESIINQEPDEDKHKIILAVMDTIVIPIAASDMESPEDQIVMFTKKKHEDWNLGPESLYYDAGMRTSLVTAFSRVWSPKVNSIDFGGKPSERPVSRDIDITCRDYYANFVTELWYSTRLAIEAGQIRGMPDELVQEGCAREWTNVGANKIKVETKDDMKLKCGRSPDLYDCFACGLEGARQKGFVISRLSSGEALEKDNRWKRELLRKAIEARVSHELIYNV